MNSSDHIPQPESKPNGAVTLHQKGDIANILIDSSPRKQSMAGFDDEFKDIVQYIIAITHRIWEEKAIGEIYRYYKHNTVIHTSSGDIYGREQVVAGTIQSLAAFPDRRLYGDEVIWKHSEGDLYYSSHRITHEGRNTGHTAYGPPTGKKMRYRAIADCVVKDNQIIEEWLVRDELTLVHQLGFDAFEMARKIAQLEKNIARTVTVPGEVERLRGQLPPKDISPNQSDTGSEDWIRTMFHEVWNWRMLNKVNHYFTESLVAESASNRRLHGLGSYKAYILSLLSPFPDLNIRVEHFCANEDGENTLTATRWIMQGTHTGPGIYGPPTGKPIEIIGVSHHLISNGQIVHEWTLFDEFALLKQLYAPD